MLAVIVSLLIAGLLLAIGQVDRDDAGMMRWSGRVWTLVGLSVICGWIAAGAAMWADPDRLREGPAYWTLALPLFGIGCWVEALACLLVWWTFRWILKCGWLPALLIPLAAWPLFGEPWGSGAALVACFTADRIFSRRTAGLRRIPPA